MHQPTDEQLVRLLQEEESGAFALLYEKYKTPVYSYCSRLLRNKQAAEDATHDAFLKIRSAARTLNNPRAFRAWIFRIARNEVMQALRRARRNGQIESDDVWEEETLAESYERAETREIVQRTLEMLKAEYKEVVVLREFEQLSYAEIAEVTGATESSVKSRIFKARKALVKKLKPYFGNNKL
ncbi:MAG: RNA polymerase sigma factor [Bacteroidota bacterium]